MADRWKLILGDALEVLPTLPTASVNAVICDPPYPCIDRPYGRMTEVDWHAMMHVVVKQCRRILKPSGSAVFILQPNSRKVGSMRAWLWEFMAWVCWEWNMVQDVWWWNTTAPPNVHCHRTVGLTRPSVKACVWIGDPDCYRDQSSVLWSAAASTLSMNVENRLLKHKPSGYTARDGRALAAVHERGGATPYNLLPIASNYANGSGAHGHGGSTPLPLCSWWVRYIVPPDGVVLDPFCGSGTTGIAAIQRDCSYIGIDKEADYITIAEQRITKAVGDPTLFDAPVVGVPIVAAAQGLFDQEGT